MWFEYKSPEGHSGMLCMSEIRNITELTNGYRCWFKNLSAYQDIDNKTYNDIRNYMKEQGEEYKKSYEIDNRNYLI